MKRKIQLDELVDAQVGWLSVVDRGANRAPFKVQKDEGGIDVAGLNFTDIFKSEPFQPRVLAVAVAKGVDLEKAKAVIEKAGLSTEVAKTVDDAIVFLQGADALEGAKGQVVRVGVNKAIAAVCDVSKGFSPFNGSTDFDENLKSMGFLPTFDLGVDALRTTVFESLFEADSNEEAASDVQKAARDFASFISEMVSELPETVFKLEQLSSGELVPTAEDLALQQFAQPKGDDIVASNIDNDQNADRTAGEEGVAGLAFKAEIKKALLASDGFEDLKLDDDAVESILTGMVEKAVAGINPSGVADGTQSNEGSPGSPVVGLATDQEFQSPDGVSGGRPGAGTSNPAVGSTDDPADSSHMDGTSLDPTGVTKDEVAKIVADALAVAMGPVNELLKGLGTKTEEAIKKAEAADAAATGRVLGFNTDDADEGGRQVVTNSEPAFIDTAFDRLSLDS